jgi:hypothetical protein
MDIRLLSHAFTALDDRRDPPNLRRYPSVPQADFESPSPQQPRNRFSFAPAEGPCADVRTADAGAISRYWTVRFRHGGSVLWDCTHVIACDSFKATLVVRNRRPSAAEIEVMREISRAEFERLTRVSE